MKERVKISKLMGYILEKVHLPKTIKDAIVLLAMAMNLTACLIAINIPVLFPYF